MSGNKGARGHNNQYAFRHNPNSKKTEKILTSPNEGVCQVCWEMIEWRKKYRKYKPLTVMRRCDVCHLKAVRLAYHTACQPCTEARGKCAKCGKEPVHHPYQVVGVASKEDEERVLLLKMTERQRRTYFRELEREQGGGRKKKQANDSDPELSDDDDGEDDLGDMPAPPTNKFDPDMLVKERAARAGVQEEGKTKKSDENDDEDSNSDNLDGSAESYEEDSDELDRLDAEAEKLVGKRDPLTQNDDGEDAGSEDEAGSESEDEE